jgi:hypothetical protein
LKNKTKRKTKMKKLMVILGAALMCSVASAANVLWSASYTFSDSAGVEFSDSRNITAYLFDASTVAQNTLFDSWNNGATDLSGAKVTSTWYDAYQLDVTDNVGSTGSKSLYWVVVNGDDLFVSSVQTQEISQMGGTEFAWDDESGKVFADKQSSFAGAGWYTTAAVPEPTSGLLMLVGLAGLALRRKRA